MLLIRRLIFLILISCAAIAAHCFSAAPQSDWFILSLLLLSLIEMGDTFIRRVSIIVIVGLAVGMTVFISGVLSTHVVFLAFALTATTLCCVYIGSKYPEYFLLTLILNVCAILSGTLSATMPEYTDRMMYVLCATIVVTSLQVIYLPRFTRNELRFWLSKTLQNLELCNKEIFSCFVHAEYITNLYLFERRIHTQKIRLMQSLHKSRQMVTDSRLFITNADRDVLSQWLASLEYVYTIILDCAQLRRRVTDHTVFGLCGNEMDGISTEVVGFIRSMLSMLRGREGKLDAIALSIRIKHLDENYHNVLRITAREPLVFVLYIASLKTLNDELIKLYKNTSLMIESLERV